MVEDGPRLRCDWEYNLALFDHATITRLMDHYQRLLEGIAASPDRRVSDLPLLGEDERRWLLATGNGVTVRVGPDECIHQLVEEQARRAPEAVAIVDGDEQVTYGQLDRRADAVAARLRALGVGPEDRVGVCARRRSGTVAALLGVLKAGGAYVPLDPAQPVEPEV